MDLSLDNKVNTNTLKENEIEDFMQELQNSLTNDKTNNLYNEILKEMPLASKYESQLCEIIKDSMEELSYEYDFLYFDYDKNKKNYYFDLYSEGEITREYLSKDDAKDIELKKGTFWHIWDENNILESEDLKENIKIRTESELDSLEWENKKGK